MEARVNLSESSKRVVLGTAQLGLSYGIDNQGKKPEQTTTTKIIAEAWESGICEFDTAQGYGKSEEFLGHSFTDLGINDRVQVISKFSPSMDHLDVGKMRASLENSLRRINVPRFLGMMLHNEEALANWDRGLSETLLTFKKEGLVQKVGVSVYTPEKAIEAAEMEGIDLIQFPSNIWDRRFEKTGILELSQTNNKQTYLRNVFLQGLILMEPVDLPKGMEFAIPTLERLSALCDEFGMTRQEVSLAYLKLGSPSSKIVLGVNKLGQISKNIDTWNQSFPTSLLKRIRDTFSAVSDDLVQPLSWPVKFW
jgi:aryl-alcohol dehydrogenase-like predicted oxidoreductase